MSTCVLSTILVIEQVTSASSAIQTTTGQTEQIAAGRGQVYITTRLESFNLPPLTRLI
jgi:hypothetical protein